MKNPYAKQFVNEYYIDRKIRTDKCDAWAEGYAARKLPTVEEMKATLYALLSYTPEDMAQLIVTWLEEREGNDLSKRRST